MVYLIHEVIFIYDTIGCFSQCQYITRWKGGKNKENRQLGYIMGAGGGVGGDFVQFDVQLNSLNQLLKNCKVLSKQN